MSGNRPISNEQLLKEVEYLSDEYIKMKKMYEDLFYNLDMDNFSKELREDMDKFYLTFKEVFPDGSANESSFLVTAQKIEQMVAATYQTKTDAGIQYVTLQSSITQTADNILSVVAATYETQDSVTQKISVVQQTADKISWLVADGTSASNFTLTSRMASLVAGEINLTGYVTFNALSTAGQTIINGDNIKTGVISWERLEKPAQLTVWYELYNMAYIWSMGFPYDIIANNVMRNHDSIVNIWQALRKLGLIV